MNGYAIILLCLTPISVSLGYEDCGPNPRLEATWANLPPYMFMKPPHKVEGAFLNALNVTVRKCCGAMYR